MPRKPRLVPILLHAALIAIGVAAIVWALTVGLHPRITCHGTPMHAGDSCARIEIDGSDKGRTQSYAAALAERRQAVPVIVGMGALAAGFGAALLVGELRRGRREAAESQPRETSGETTVSAREDDRPRR